jgi:hypothetical protein
MESAKPRWIYKRAFAEVIAIANLGVQAEGVDEVTGEPPVVG